MKKIEKLLKEIEVVNQKGKELSILKGENFNVFQIFDMERDENKMHSRFIETLLNPKGSHDRGTVFLELFLKEINQEIYFKNLERVTTKVEHSVGKVNNKKKEKEDKKDSIGGRIDIYLWDNKKSISIENKIYADDGENQIIRYCNHNKENNIVYYLNLYGDSPSDVSRGDLKNNIDFYCISYSETIFHWLEKCQKEVSDYPIIRETIKQYIITIKRLTGQLINQEMEEDIKNLIKNNFESAEIIVNNFENAKIDLVDNFLSELAKDLEEKLNKGSKKVWTIKKPKSLKDKNRWEKFRISKKNWKDDINIVLEGHPFFWKGIILGVLKNNDSENIIKTEKDVEAYNFIKNTYSKNNGNWLYHNSIFKWNKKDKDSILLDIIQLAEELDKLI